MYQLTIATDEGARTTRHTDPGQVDRALLAYAIQADVYLHGDRLKYGSSSGATDPIVITLLQLDPASGRPMRVGTATIAASASVAPTAHSQTGTAAS